MNRKDKLTKAVFLLNGALFLLGGVSLIMDGKYIFGIIQLFASVLNLAMILKIDNNKIAKRMNYTILAMNAVVCISLAIDSILSNKSYIQFIWFFAAIASFVALFIQYRKNKNSPHGKFKMNSNPKVEIFSARLLDAPLEIAHQAFANPYHLIKWWGPEGFTNTFHEFDLRPNGKWILTMHGPEKGNYENSSIFKAVEPMRLISWTRISQPIFDMEVAFEQISQSKTRISFRMIFDTAEACEKIRGFAEPKNEENFDRLEKELLNVHV